MMRPVDPLPPDPPPPALRRGAGVLDVPEVRWWEWTLLAVAFVALILFCVWLGM